MTKHQIAKGPWVVMKAGNRASQYGGIFTEITMVNNYGVIAHTMVDPENRNAKKWQDIIDLTERGWGIILDDMRYKVKNEQVVCKNRTNEPLIDADSKVKPIIMQKDKQEVLDQLVEVLSE